MRARLIIAVALLSWTVSFASADPPSLEEPDHEADEAEAQGAPRLVPERRRRGAPEPPPPPEVDPSDTTPPTITDVDVRSRGSRMTVTWRTDEPASSELEFDEYGRIGYADRYVTEHSVTLRMGREAYTFRVVSKDVRGNSSASGIFVTTR